MPILEPIKLLPARDRVASALRKAIISGEFKSGQTLSLERVASQLQVSATPVREAYQQLAMEGLIKLRPNKEAEVVGPTEGWVRDHFGLRAVLEAEAARLVAKGSGDLSALEANIAKQKETMDSGKWAHYSDLNQSFHLEIWSLCGNGRIKSVLENLWNGLSLGASVAVEDYAQVSFAEHEKIFRAIEDRDEKASYELMYAHIMRSMESMLTHLK